MQLRRNVLAGIGGYGWAALIQLAATPILIRLIGAEAFGLFGIYLAIQAASRVLDLGISPTVSRELARSSASGSRAGATFFFSIERGYWGVGFGLGLILALTAPILANFWSRTSSLPQDQIGRTILVMGVLLAVQWPIILYEAALTGLQRITRLHAVGTMMRGLGVLGGVAALQLWRRELWIYLVCLAGAAILHVLTLAIALRRDISPSVNLKDSDPPDRDHHWRFATGMSVITVLSAVLIHSDKVILSGLLPLAAFGHYALASMIASGLYVLAMPVFHAVFPALSGQIAIGDRKAESEIYHSAAQGLAALVVPAAAVLALFARDLLRLWTADGAAANEFAPVLQLLVVGTAFNTLMTVPYALQLAHGQTRIAIGIHVLLIGLFLPLLAVGASIAGPVGAASAWFALNFMYLAAGGPVTHYYLLRGETKRWLVHDLAGPVLAGLGTIVICWAIVGRFELASLQRSLAGALMVVLAWGVWALTMSRRHFWRFLTRD